MGSGHAAGARGVRLWWGRDSRQASRCPRARPTPWGSGGTGKMGPRVLPAGKTKGHSCPQLSVPWYIPAEEPGLRVQRPQRSGPTWAHMPILLLEHVLTHSHKQHTLTDTHALMYARVLIAHTHVPPHLSTPCCVFVCTHTHAHTLTRV